MKTNEIPAAASSSRSDRLRDVRSFIERGWTQDTYARDEHGKELLPLDANAVCWCLSGAAIAASQRGVDNPRATLADALCFARVLVMQDWNDEPGRTQAEVLARIDQALERAGGGA